MKQKWLKMSLLSLSACFLMSIGVACQPSAGTSSSSQEPIFTGFLEESATVVQLGDTMYLNEFIDYVTDAEYTITIALGDYVETVTKREMWEPVVPGEYVITYTVKGGEHEGTYTHTFTVPAQRVEWQYTARGISKLYQTEMTFEELYRDMNVFVDSYYEHEMFVKNVRVDDVITDLTGKTSYTFNSLADHYFTVGFRTADGQERKAIVTVQVEYSTSKQTLYINGVTTGECTYDVAGVTQVLVNGEPCTDAVVTGTSVSFDKQTLRKKYEGTNFISFQTPNGEHRETLYVYTEKMSFEGENSVAPSFMTWNNPRQPDPGTMRITSDYVTDGEKSLLLLCGSSYNPVLEMDLAYFDMIFSDPEVTKLAFDFTYVGPNETYSERVFAFGHLPVQEKELPNYFKRVTLENGKTTTFSISREDYEEIRKNYDVFQIVGNNTREASGGVDSNMNVYTDNWRAVYGLESEFVYVEKDDESMYTFDMSGVGKVLLNGVMIPEEYLQITQTSINVAKAYLFNHLGEQTLQIVRGEKTYEKPLSIYTNYCDYEGENAGNIQFLSWLSGGTTAIVDFNGSKALRLRTGATTYPQVQISGAWLDAVFADPEIESVLFDVTFVCENAEATVRELVYFYGMRTSFAMLENGQTQTLQISRALYDTWTATKQDRNTPTYFQIVVNNEAEKPGGCVALDLYFDNVKASKGLNEKTLYVTAETTGNLEIAVNGATQISLNGTVLSSSQCTVTATSVSIPKSLFSLGANVLEIAAADGVYVQNVNVYGDQDFTDITNATLATQYVLWDGGARSVWKDGDKATAVCFTMGNSGWAWLDFKRAWVDAIFADENVESFSFTLMVQADYTAKKVFWHDWNNGVRTRIELENDTQQTVTITRAQYEYFVSTSAANADMRFGFNNDADSNPRTCSVQFDNVKVSYGNK